MSLLLLQIGSLPLNRSPLTNRVYISPSTFQELFRGFNHNDSPAGESDIPLITVGSRVYAADADNLVPTGQLALSDFQRSDGNLRLGTKVKVKNYSPSPEYEIAGLEFQVDSLIQRSPDGNKAVTPKEIDTDHLFSYVIENYKGFVVAIGQILVIDFEGTDIELTVSSFEFMSPLSLLHVQESTGSSFIPGQIGQLVMETCVQFYGKKRGTRFKKKRVHLTGSKVSRGKSSLRLVDPTFLGGMVKKLASQTKSFSSSNQKRSTTPSHQPCSLIHSVDRNDLKDTLDNVNPAIGKGVKRHLFMDEKKIKNVKAKKKKKEKITKIMSFRITLKSLGGIIMSNSIVKRGKGQKELPIFAVLSYPNEPLNNTKTCTWSNIPSAPLKSASSSIGNRERYFASFALVQEENYAIKFAFPMKRRKGCSNTQYIPQEINLRLGLMRGTEVIAAGIATIYLNGTEEGQLQNIPVKRSKSKQETVVKAGSFQSDPNKKYSLQRSFLRVIVDADDPIDEETTTSDLCNSSHVRKVPAENFFSRFTDGISRLVKKNSIWSSSSTADLSLSVHDSEQGNVPVISSNDDEPQGLDESNQKIENSVYKGCMSRNTMSTDILSTAMSTDILSSDGSTANESFIKSSSICGSVSNESRIRYTPQLSMVFTDTDSFEQSLPFGDTEETSIASTQSSASSLHKNKLVDEGLSVTFSDNQSMSPSQLQHFDFCSEDSMSFDSESTYGSSEEFDSSVYDSSDSDTEGGISLISLRSDLLGCDDQYSDTDVSYS